MRAPAMAATAPALDPRRPDPPRAEHQQGRRSAALSPRRSQPPAPQPRTIRKPTTRIQEGPGIPSTDAQRQLHSPENPSRREGSASMRGGRRTSHRPAGATTRSRHGHATTHPIPPPRAKTSIACRPQAPHASRITTSRRRREGATPRRTATLPCRGSPTPPRVWPE